MSDSNRFVTLDALRGIAAIGIMLFHSPPNNPVAMGGGYLAVDLFFGLSGFVIALTYGDKLRRGMSPRLFLSRRAIRLWPMLVIGALAGIVLHQGHLGMLFLLPFPYSDSLYPANPPFWSLLSESIAYLGFAAFGFRLQIRGLLAVLIISGISLLGFAIVGEARLHEFGAFWSRLPAGLARLAYSFTCGVIICRLRMGQGLPRVRSRRAWFLIAALLGIMLFVPSPGQLWGVAIILLVLPTLIWFATKWDLPAPRLALALGALSYPLYCIHMPILALTAAWDPAPPFFVIWGTLIAVSLLLDHYWDRPVQRLLTNRLSNAAHQTRIGIST